MAAQYAGLGTVGVSHNLLTSEFDPRARFVFVFISAKFKPDRMHEGECAANAFFDSHPLERWESYLTMIQVNRDGSTITCMASSG